MESLGNGSFSPFSNWAPGLLSSACSLSCSDKQHYHRHCGCALHSIGTGYKGSPSCSPSCTVKVSRSSGARSGMHRSLSVQNFGEKRYNCASCGGNSYSAGESASCFDFSLNSSDLVFGSPGSFSHLQMKRENVPSAETLNLVEELASFIHLVKDGDSGSTSEGTTIKI